MSTAGNDTQSIALMPFGGSADILMPLGVVGILGVMILPLPTVLLDLLLTLNISFSLVILLLAMYILKPLELSSFPSILLLLTLFRLSLNIASTRIILLNGSDGVGAAGKVIQSFGSFVVGGNYVVGVIVFVILVVINFAVITKGAGRIAEVAARFTLDAMPGKQMSIDADLNAGVIEENEAKRRRLEISREAEYYGAMDGANKFVRGDAVAGIIITLINIIGGLIIGVFQGGMNFADAAETYTLLTVGDGLVSQSPALIISTAAGILVTRAGSQSGLGGEVSSQVLSQPRAILLAGVVLSGFAIVPGMPGPPFLIMALLCFGLQTIVKRATREGLAVAEAEAGQTAAEPSRSEPVRPLPPVDALAMEVGYGLIPLVDVEQDGELLERIKSIRRQMAQDIGIVVPSIHIQDNMQLKPGEYRISLKGNTVARGEMLTNFLLAMNPAIGTPTIDGVATREPTYGLPALWIKPALRERAIADGYTVVDLPTVLTTHLAEMIRRHAHELVGRQEVQQLLDRLKETHPKVVEELVPNLLSLGAVVKVIQNLLREQVPVRDLLAICETLADWAPMSTDPDVLTEYVRQALARTICRRFQNEDGSLPVLTLSPAVETTLHESLQKTPHGTFLALDPARAREIVEAVSARLPDFETRQSQPVTLCPAHLRIHLKRLLDRFLSDVTVLSYDEIVNTVKIQPLASVKVADAN